MLEKNTISQSIQYGYEFKIGEYISRGFKIFKDNPGGYLGYTLVFFVTTIIIQLIPLLGFLIAIVVSPPLSVGIAIAAHRQVNEDNLEFGNFFKGFDYIGQLIVAYIIMLCIYFIIALPLVFLFGLEFLTAFASADPEIIMDSYHLFAKMGIWIFIFLAIFTYIGVCLRWTNYLIVFHKYDAVSAIKTSWQLVNKRWIWHYFFVLLCILIMIGGILALIIGTVAAYPIIMAADYMGFADTTGLNERNDEISEIGIDSELV